MRAKLIKRDDDFYSLKVDGIVMATSNGMLVDYRLSLKNCQSVELGVDLDTLVLSFYPKTEWGVEIVMEIVSCECGMQYSANKVRSCWNSKQIDTNPEKFKCVKSGTEPKLDENGCLILKRIKE